MSNQCALQGARRLLLSSVFAGMVLPAVAGWTVIVLSPVPGGFSQGHASGPGLQGGYTYPNDVDHAALWSGTASSHIDVNPANAASSAIYAVGNDGKQGGYAGIGNRPRAYLWSGSATGGVDLDPMIPDTDGSYVYGCNDGQQVGGLFGTLGQRAALWTGTAGSYVSLEPPGAQDSLALACRAGQQAGTVSYFNGIYDEWHAVKWSGSAASVVDLNPGSGYESQALGISDTQQVGWVVHNGGFNHAALWSGSAGSFVDLHPTEELRSTAYAVWGGMQAGEKSVDAEIQHACVWTGTALSVQDLHVLLPGEIYFFSTARGIWKSGTTTYVVGFAGNQATGMDDAILWVHTADGVNISGHVNTNGARTLTSLDVEFRAHGSTTPIGTAVALVDGNGNYSVAAPGNGDYDLSVNPRSYLRRTIHTNTTAGSVTNADLNLLPGDIEDDTVVDIADYTLLATAFDKSSSDSDWLTVGGNGHAPYESDLNADGIVDIADYTILALFFDAVGDN